MSTCKPHDVVHSSYDSILKPGNGTSLQFIVNHMLIHGFKQGYIINYVYQQFPLSLQATHCSVVWKPMTKFIECYAVIPEYVVLFSIVAKVAKETE